ncbi:MAG: dihydrofolate reductase, partial [Oscillospiraceae bacterium]|nr:dihydrofolate reductase [Oscillospiraceae bacterium]
FASMDALLAEAPEDAFVIGGASVYQALMDRCDTAYITKIAWSFPDTDCWFPDLDQRPEWRTAEEGPELEEKGVKFRYVTYRRR